ncbi:LIM domain transcription factor LMO4.1 [Culicoides brevitarsis]|uniref:LIM domain transcription factor LMO4.1 n=1 Tax=Culicoides brevitarsis TaxID=469753 RepID=UPI00307BE446
MNPHYHPYPDISSPHHQPPSPDNTNYSGNMPSAHHHNGHMAPNHMDGQQNFHQMNNNMGPVKFCAGCGGKILDRFIMCALDRYWHNSCLKCSCCHEILTEMGSTCFTKSNMILCKNDYSRLFRSSGACSACGETIPANELVMRTTSQINPNQNGVNNNNNYQNQPLLQHHVFHLKCFQCSKCANNLQQGDRYYMLGGSIVCEQDWHKLIKTSSAPNPPLRKGKVGRPRRSRD